MPRKGPPPKPVALTEEDRAKLEALLRRGKTEQRVAKRVRIILALAAGATLRGTAKEVGVSAAIVTRWKNRFLELGVDGLADDDRPGPPRTILDEQVHAIVVKTLEEMPAGASRWSTRDMAKAAGVSQSTVSRIWRAYELKPHRSETFQLSTDPLFIEKVHDVVGLYLNPPDNAVVLSVDEKSQIQALSRTQPLLPFRPGQLERRTPEYRRHGTTTLFAAFNTVTGKVITDTHRRHRTEEFLKFLRLIDNSVEQGLEIHVIADNYATHKSPRIKSFLVRNPRFHMHFTPTHASWLNQVEGWFSILTEKQLKRGSHTSVAQLEAAIREFVDAHNADPSPFRWVKTAEEILANVARFCRDTLAAHLPHNDTRTKDSPD